MEFGARARFQLGDLHLEALVLHSFIDLATEDQLLLVVMQREAAGRAGDQRQLHAQIRFGHIELEYFELFPTPRIAGQAEQRGGQRAISRRVMLARHEGAEHREVMGFGDDVEL